MAPTVIVDKAHCNKLQWYARTKFQDSTKYTSQVTGFQTCAIGITPFRKAGHKCGHKVQTDKCEEIFFFSIL